MDEFARRGGDDRLAFINEAAARRDVTPIIIEKDFWVCWTLRRLMSVPVLEDNLTFKGGTSLSKAYGIIARFGQPVDGQTPSATFAAQSQGTAKGRARAKSLPELFDEKLQRHVVSDRIVRDQHITPRLAAIGASMFGRPGTPLHSDIGFRQDILVGHLGCHLWLQHQNGVGCLGDEVRLVLKVIRAAAVIHLELAFGGSKPFESFPLQNDG